jgi:TolA-binding protein
MMRFSTYFAGAFAAGVLLSPISLAQGSDLQIDKGIEFAQGLASRWQFVDLAQEVLDELAAGTRLSSDQEENIALVRCEIFGTAARLERDDEKINGRFEAAIQAYGDFISGNEYSTFKSQAERSLVKLATSYAAALELQLLDQIGEEAGATREKVREILIPPLQTTGALIGEIDQNSAPSEKEKREKYALMLDRGKMLAAMGRSSEDGTSYFGRAETTLENLAMEAGETTGWGLQAVLELARTKAGQNDWEGAIVFYKFVADLVMPIDPDAWDGMLENLDAAGKDQHWVFMELAIPGLLEATGNLGDTKLGTAWALHFYNRYKSEGFQLSRPRGYFALLASAKTLLDAGGYVGGNLNGGGLTWYDTLDAMEQAESSKRNRRSAVDLALTMAQTANEDNRGNTLQTKAQKLISEVIDRPGMKIGPDILFEAAQGHYKQKDYPTAISAFKRTLAALDNQDDATRTLFGPKILNHLGKSFFNEGRYLEAAMAFEEGVTTWRGSIEFDNLNAKGMYEALQIQKIRTGKDDRIEAIWLEAEGHVRDTALTEDVGELVFDQAMREYHAENYEQAYSELSDVPKGTDSYELALVRKAICRYKQGRTDDAIDGLADYLGPFLDSPDNVTTSQGKLAKRAKAMPLAAYYLGLIHYNAKDWSSANDLLATFHVDYPGQDLMAPNAIYMSLLAYLGLGDISSARGQQQILQDSFPTSSRTGRGAGDIYKTVANEYEDTVPAGKNQVGDLAMLQTMAELMKTDNGLASTPTYRKLRNESEHWMDLENWEEATRALDATVKAFASDESQATGLNTYVRPDLGFCLVKLGRLPDALEVLRPLVPPASTPAGEPKPAITASERTITTFSRAAIGWVQGENMGTIKEVLGVGTEDDVAMAAAWLQKLTNREEKYSAGWYQLKFDTIFAWRRLGENDSGSKASALRQLNTLKQDVDTDLSGIEKDFTDEGLDGSALRQQFLWLGMKLL